MNGGVREKLRSLVRIDEGRFPFISCYLDLRLDGPEKPEQVRIFLKNRLRDVEGVLDGGEAERASFRSDAERIQRYVDDRVHQVEGAGHGHAIFACAGRDIFESLRTARPFSNQLIVSNRPVIRQLAVLVDEFEPVIAAVVDTRTARIFEIALGEMVHETDVLSDVPRNVKVPEYHGYGDLKYQRDLKGHVDHHFKDVAEQLARLADRGYRRIILLGQEPVLAAFRKTLPKRVEERVIATGSVDRRHEATDRILARALDLLKREEQRAERELVSLIRDQALSGNLGVFGIEATLDALRKGQVYKLAVDGSLAQPGWRCRSCRALLSHTRDDRCPYCREPVSEVDLGDEIVKDAIAQGAELETVAGSADLARMGKVGALLRFKE